VKLRHFIALGLIGLLAFTAAGCGDSTEEGNPEGKYIEIDAKDLNSEYQEDETAADTEYKGKMLRVSGVISRVGHTVQGKRYVNLSTEFTYVRCNWSNKHKQDFTALKQGKEVELECECAGKVEGGVVLNNCSLVN
jgi:hypothetical protein